MTPKWQESGRATLDLVERQLTGRIVECFHTVYNALDFGLLEGVYRNALVVELSRVGIRARTEVPIEVLYRGIEVGFFRLDVLLDEKIAVEIKATELLPAISRRQLLNYLRASTLDVGLLLHFGPRPKCHRLVSPRVTARTREERILPFP
jgi:GxxExxY protein